ncbi:MAG: ATP-dependent sacrificial sulfur transferase LarE [Methanomassiliicoccales archaeon]
MSKEDKLVKLKEIVQHMRSVAVAFSGGVDSTLLLKVAHEVLGDKVIAVTSASETFASWEEREAVALANIIGVRIRFVHSKEMEDDCFVNNPPDRCYYCKKSLFAEIRRIAEGEGIAEIADGNNADDLQHHRPGKKASEEMGVRSPLAEAGLTKNEIRSISREMGLRTADKPQNACLASRIPYDEKITLEKLVMIETAEDRLRSLGLAQLRVRHHGLIARIEVPEEAIEIVAKKRGEIVRALKDVGFIYVTLDLEGFRSGSMLDAVRHG